MGVKLIPFDAADFLKDEKTIAEYLNACMETGDSDVVLSALSSAARARGMADLADRAGVNRESLYKALAPGAKPRYDTIFKVVRALGIDMVFRAPPPAKAPSRPPSTNTHKPRPTTERGVSASSRASAGQIILTPVRIQRGDAVRAKLAELNLGDSDTAAAVGWARRKASAPALASGPAAGREAGVKPKNMPARKRAGKA